LQSTVYGYICGSIAGIALGFLLGRVRFLAEMLDPLILAVYSIPKIALAPLFILWFGIGMFSKVVIAAVTVFFLVFYNTYRGAREVDPDLIDAVRIMGGNRRQVLFGVVLPSSMVWIFTGLRIAIPYALTGAVVGEIVASNKGVGHMLKVSANTFDTTGMFVMLGVLVVTSSIIFVVLNRFEKKRSGWSATHLQE
jgi:NitT/TauT family transport system permease protein